MVTKKTKVSSARKPALKNKSVKQALKTKTVKKAVSTIKKIKAVKETSKKIIKKVPEKAKKIVKTVRKVAKNTGKKVLSKVISPSAIEVTITSMVDKEIPKEQHFYLRDGRAIKNVIELIDAFDSMTEEVFRHHVTDVNNDFSNWLHHVFEEEKLAKEVKNAKNKAETQLKLLKHVVRKLAD